MSLVELLQHIIVKYSCLHFAQPSMEVVVWLGKLGCHCSTRFNRFYFGTELLTISSKDIVGKELSLTHCPFFYCFSKTRLLEMNQI